MDIFSQIAQAKSSGGNRLREGEHTLVLRDFRFVPTQKAGQVLRAMFVVAESNVYSAGTIAEVAFFINGRWPENELSKAQQFIAEILGTTDPATVAAQGRAMVGPDQPGTGIAVRCFAQSKTSQNGKAYVNYQWVHVDQDAAAIASQRQSVEAIPVPGQQTAAVQMAPVAAPVAAPEAAPAPMPNVGNSLLGKLQ